jgi:hypothetical protein
MLPIIGDRPSHRETAKRGNTETMSGRGPPPCDASGGSGISICGASTHHLAAVVHLMSLFQLPWLLNEVREVGNQGRHGLGDTVSTSVGTPQRHRRLVTSYFAYLLPHASYRSTDRRRAIV